MNKSHRILIVFLLLFTLGVPTVLADTTVTFYPSLDGRIYYFNGVFSGIDNSSQHLMVGEEAALFPNYTWSRAFLRFDVSTIPENYTVENATLVLYYYFENHANTEGDRNVAEVADIGAVLDAGDWGNAISADYGILIPVANVSDYGFYTINVTGSITPADTFVTFRVNSTVEDADANYWLSLFRSVEYTNATFRPRLVVTLVEGPEWNEIYWLINSAFEFFGITDYMTAAIDFVGDIGAHFTLSLVNLAILINLQFQVIWQVFTWWLGWANRIITAVLNLGTTLQEVLNGTAAGAVNIWTFFNLAAWIDGLTLFIIVYWIDSLGKRAETQGTFTVLMSDLQIFANVFSFFMTAFANVIGFIEGKISWLFQAIT